MQEKRRIRNIKILLMTFILVAGLCVSTTSYAAPKKKPTKGRSAKGRSGKSRGRATRGRGGRASRYSRGGRSTTSRSSRGGSSRGGKLVPARDSRGRVKRDRRGRIMYARVAPPKPRPGAEIPASRVGEIQRALASQGFYKGEAGGTYDDSTKSAMQSFQTAHGLKATGYPTAQTLKMLGLTKPTAPNGGTTAVTDSPTTRPRTVGKKNP